jgi:hypothetical protein
VLPAALAAGFELADPFPGGAWARRGLAGSLPGGREARVVRTDAYEDGTDGFFVAVFERLDAAAGGEGASRGSAGGGGGGGSVGSKPAGGGPADGAPGVRGEAQKKNKRRRKEQG